MEQLNRVTLEQAKALMELGYQQDDYADAIYIKNGYRTELCYYGDDDFYSPNKICDAPYYEEAIKWLCECRHLFISIVVGWQPMFGYGYCIYNTQHNTNPIKSYTDYITYDCAMSDALDSVIKILMEDIDADNSDDM